MTELKCGNCHQWKPAEDFPPDPTKWRGRRQCCDDCKPWKKSEALKATLPPRVVEAMCGKKRRYGSRGRALAVALHSARRTTLMRVYRCPVCDGWHLTHKKARAA